MRLGEKTFRCIFLGLYGLVWVLSFVPFHLSQSMGRLLGRILGAVPKGRVDVSLNNLRTVFGNELSERELLRLNKQVVVHFAQMFFEVPHVLRLNRANLHRYAVFENDEVFRRALQQGRGTFILTAHFGNWELMSAAIALQFNVNGAVVVRPVDFKPADQLLEILRSRFGTEIIPKRRAMKRLLSAMRNNRAVGILLDQNVAWYEGVFVPFLGSMACTNKGLALVAARTGSPVIPTFSIRQPDGRYRITFEPPIQLEQTGDKVMDIETNTARFTQAIERYVVAYPDQWFWFHRRWKTKPYCSLPAKFYDPKTGPGRV
ncbi:MAG: lysophospholipid acyltransferase family protein [Thermodesulfobacteriota bacterium]